MIHSIDSKHIILQLTNIWRFKNFALGLHLSSAESYENMREYYILVSLGFWQISIGIRA